jgi:hypothetical protein
MVRAVLFDVAGTPAMPEARDAWPAGVDLGGSVADHGLAAVLALV